MKAQELRIGSLVYDNLGGILKIKGISIDSELYHLKPIPLTEEWLLKFGFEIYHSESTKTLFSYKTNNALAENITKDFEIYVNLEYGISISLDSVEVQENGDLECINIKLNHIKYIHQLQNLYFALTNEELICHT